MRFLGSEEESNMVVGLRAFRARLSRNQKIRKAQSLVEFTVLLPVILIMLSGLVEASFALNVYLDLTDSAREVSRYLSDKRPFNEGTLSPNTLFYDVGRELANQQLEQAGQIQLDQTTDNIVISIFRVTGSTVAPDKRYPTLSNDEGCLKGGEIGWIGYCNTRESKFGTTACGTKPDCIVMADLLGDLVAPDTGIVAVEIFYDHYMVLKLPWITAFIPDPITLHAYSFMPNAAAEP